MSTTVPSQDPFIMMIRRAIEDEIRRITEDEMAGVAAKVQKRVRERVGAISAAVFSELSMERRGPELLIKVKFEGTE